MSVMTMIFFLVSIQVASAQEAMSFEQLQLLVKPGDNVYVTDSKGVVTKGKITGLTPSILSLKEKSGTRDWSEADVSRIMQYRHDSLKNGTLIGTGIMFGLSAISVATCGSDEACDLSTGEKVGVVLINTGLGAAIGAGIDALIHQKQTVYIGRPRAALNLSSVRPILTKDRKGVVLSMSF
jgi:hypothetical protein